MSRATAASITRQVKAHLATKGIGQVPVRTRHSAESTVTTDLWQTFVFEDSLVANVMELSAAMSGYPAARVSVRDSFVSVITETEV